jgi:6-pyruvoyltetrahydropterin/6-carboxytetrahydropterin synthase
MKLTRRVTFSAGHRYWLTNLSEAENRARFGIWASPFNHGHNYILDVTTTGDLDPENGMVVNIKTIDDILKRDIVSQFDQRSINDQIPFFATHPSSLENIAAYIWSELRNLPPEAQLDRLRLEEMPTLWVELTNNDMTLTRTYEFAASHRLHNPGLSQEQNDELFGKCNNPAGHGHNYILEVTVTGELDEHTGFLCSLDELDSVVNLEVVDRYDHKNLNEDIPEFNGRMTTSEIVVQEIWQRLDGRLPATLYRVRLHETARNIFEVTRGA